MGPTGRQFPVCPLFRALHVGKHDQRALRRLGFEKDEMTGLGFRSAPSSMLNESGLWNADAIERQLAHVDNDSWIGMQTIFDGAIFGNC